MNNEVYNCNDCNKTYSCYRSLWTHNKNHHNGIKIEKNIEKNPKMIETHNTIYNCRTCNKKYKHKQTRYTHEKTCNGIKQTDKEIELEKIKLEVEKTKIEQETERIKQESLKLQIKLQGMKQIDNKTFKAINKILMDRSTHNTMNNTQNITNNYHFPKIFSIGHENVVETLSLYDKQLIMDRKWGSLDEIVEIVHCGTHNMFKNIIITNLKDKFAYMYDDKKGYFITTTKTYVLDNLVNNRMMDIEAIYDELSTANKIDSKTKRMIQEFLDKMEEEDKPYTDIEDVEYPNYKSYKMHNIKILLYNNQDKMTQDVALLIGDSKIGGSSPSITPDCGISRIRSKKENKIPNNEIVKPKV